MKKTQILIKGHRHFDQANQGQHSWGPTHPSSPVLPALILAKKKKKPPRFQPPGSSLTVGCSQHISALRGLHIPLCAAAISFCPGLEHEHHQQNKQQRLGRSLTYIKNRLSQSTTLAETRCACSGEEKKHAHSPPGRPQPKP